MRNCICSQSRQGVIRSFMLNCFHIGLNQDLNFVHSVIRQVKYSMSSETVSFKHAIYLDFFIEI